jgi:hypothetical protein
MVITSKPANGRDRDLHSFTPFALLTASLHGKAFGPSRDFSQPRHKRLSPRELSDMRSVGRYHSDCDWKVALRSEEYH